MRIIRFWELRPEPETGHGLGWAGPKEEHEKRMAALKARIQYELQLPENQCETFDEDYLCARRTEKHWSEQELLRLRSAWENRKESAKLENFCQRLAEELGRTAHAVRRRLHILGLYKSRSWKKKSEHFWSDAQRELLTRLWSTRPATETIMAFAARAGAQVGRKTQAVYSQMTSLGLIGLARKFARSDRSDSDLSIDEALVRRHLSEDQDTGQAGTQNVQTS